MSHMSWTGKNPLRNLYALSHPKGSVCMRIFHHSADQTGKHTMINFNDSASNRISGVLAPELEADGPEADQIWPEPSEDFVLTPFLEAIVDRALGYLEIGCPLHLCGPAGSGKTTLAFHLASRLGRPVTLIHGDDEFGSSDLIGKDNGYRKSKLVDNFIHSVMKTEEEMKSLWVDNRLTQACRSGNTLIYDEFTRSRPEANNPLLSILEERILNLPKLRKHGESCIEVHNDFKAIFTSNPEEYAGIHKSQDALMDRLVTITLDHPDFDTEASIVEAKSGISKVDAETIVKVVRAVREMDQKGHRASIRAGLFIARMLVHRNAQATPRDPIFQAICMDVLYTNAAKVTHNGMSIRQKQIATVIKKVCSGKSPKSQDTAPWIQDNIIPEKE